MKNKYSFNPRLILLIFTSAISLSFLNCGKDSNTATGPESLPKLFPDFFIEKGSDADSSYISFRGTKKNNDSLEIQCTGWGVMEYGLFLGRYNESNSILFTLRGYCGTVSSKTWTKVKFTDWITSTESDTLEKLSFTNFRDTLTVVRMSTN